MNLSPREKIIAISLGAVLGLYALDQVLFEPMFARLETANDAIAKDQLTLAQAASLSHNGAAASAKWHSLSEGHIGSDASAAQSKLLNHVDSVAKSAGLSLTSFKSEHGDKAMGFARAGVRASGNATMTTLAAFLQRLQSAELPVRVTDLQIKANKDGLDDLAVDMGISTIYKLPAEDAK